MDLIIKKVVRKAVSKMFPNVNPSVVKLRAKKGESYISVFVKEKETGGILSDSLNASSQKEFSYISQFIENNDEVVLICPLDKSSKESQKVVIQLTNNGTTETL